MPRIPAALSLSALLLAFTMMPVEAKDDIPFAEKLAERGYFDLAKEVCDQIRNNPKSSKDDKAAIQIVEAQINKSMADVERDADKKKKYFEDAIQAYEAFIKNNPNHPNLASAQFKIAELYQAKGSNIIEQMKAEGDKGKRAQMASEADVIFKAAADYLERLVRVFHGDPKFETELMQARYLQCVGYYLHSSLYFDDPGRQGPLAKKGISLIEEMQWSYPEDLVFMFDLWVYKGLSFQCVKEYNNALEAFSTGGALYDMVAGTDHKDNGYVVSIISRAHYFGAQCANDASKFKEAIQFADGLLKKYPNLKSERFGLACKIEKGKALAGMGITGEAMKILNEVVATGGFWGNEAATVMNKLSGGRASRLPPEVLLALADSKLQEEDYLGAIRHAQGVLGAVRTKEDAEKFVPLALYKIGTCFAYLDRPYESAIAFGDMAKRYPKAAISPRAAFEAAKCYSQIAGATGAAFDDAQYDAALSFLTKTFPGSKEAKNVQFLVAKRKEDKSRENPKLLIEAAEEYAKVPPAAEQLYELALSRVGFCYYIYARQLWSEQIRNVADDAAKEALRKEVRAQFDKGSKGFDVYLQYIKKEKTIDKSQEDERKELQYGCLDCLAHIYLHPAVKTPEKVFEIFKDIEVEYADKPEKISKAWTLMIQADLDRGKVREAEDRFNQMLEKYGATRRIPLAAKDVGFAFESEAEEAAAAGDTAKASEFRTKAAGYFFVWLAESKKRGIAVSMTETNAAGDKLYSLALETKDEGTFRKAVDVFQQMKDRAAAGEKLPIDDWKMDWKMGECLLLLKDYKTAQPIFEKLYKDKPEMGMIHQQLAEVYVGLADAGEAKYRDEAMSLVGRLVSMVDAASEPWWRSQGLLCKLLFDAGKYEELAVKMKSIRLTYPEFDKDRYGAKAMLEQVEKRLAGKGIKIDK